ncbi:MAG: T9SS type A sorting domain-containing protein [Ignavibacteriae bacterium]|nr:T9SS type A sorting domain-containing protein [Ignavibacteriota bacterium]
MRKLFVVLLFVSPAYFILHAQDQPEWKALPNAPVITGKIDDLYFINPYTGWAAVRVAGTNVYKTTDGGTSWSFTNIAAAGRSIRFTDANNGWLGSLSGAPLWRTTDGGATWSPVLDLPSGPAAVCGLFSIDTSYVFAVGRYNPEATPYFIKTTDGGANWTVKNMNVYAGSLVDIYFFSLDTGYVVGSSIEGADLNSKKALVLRTTDGGDSWNTVYQGTQAGQLCWKITFPTAATGYVSIEPFPFGSANAVPSYLKTTDGGLTWETKSFPAGTYSMEMQGIQFLADGQRGWAGGFNSLAYETTDGGATWTPSFGANLNRFRMFGDTLGYASGRTIYKFTTDPVTTVETRPDVPAFISLDQNYPNPFNPNTTIKFKLNEMMHVKLTIVDALGREVATLINEELDQGIYHKYWDATGFPSGTYFYRLVTPQYTETRKMVLVK